MNVHYIFFILKLRYLFCLIGCMTVSELRAQHDAEQALLQNYKQATTDSEKVYRLYPLINFYYAFNFENKADSLRDMQIIFAQETRSPSLILRALFPVYDYSVTKNSSNRRFKKELDFANQALEYAKSANKNEYIALAYSTMSKVYRTSGQPEFAMKNADIAFTTALGTDNDSVKIVTALESGDVSLEKRDLLMTYRKFSNADDIVNNNRNPYLLSVVYNHFCTLYDLLDKKGKAKEYMLNSIALNTENGNTKGLISDYITISTKLLDFGPAQTYLQKAMTLADSIHDPVLKLQINKVQFFQYMINDNSENTLKFLESHPDVEMFERALGDYNYQWIIGEIFLYSKKYDSALVYFKRAEPAFDINHNVSSRINFLRELAASYEGIGNYKKAIAFYDTTLQLANGTSKTWHKSNCLNALQRLYYQIGDFKKAYEYASTFYVFRDSINNLNKDRDLVLLEIDNRTKRIQKDNELAEKKLQQRHDAQYMLISIIVAVVFLLLVLLGLFTVSTTTIRVLGFFSFIFLFELITLLLDNWIHDKTHGEPWKIWLIKIGIISMIYPLHHWLEHRLIHYLLNKKLIHVGSLFFFKKFFRHSKKQTASVEETTEAVEISSDEVKPGE